ncbi:hypothetical protein [Brachyspira sp. SAP_772]|uniref:hypothetical protein n=1 Tax=Brachyspira sp. SAP_772 TaxID=2608385 RepID=UPI0012F4F09F|nr:hypothetical protein [Brachyspira sp. SAP_772]
MGYFFCYLKDKDGNKDMSKNIHIYKAYKDHNSGEIVITSKKALCNKNGTEECNTYIRGNYYSTKDAAKNHIANMDTELCSNCAGSFHSDD